MASVADFVRNHRYEVAGTLDPALLEMLNRIDADPVAPAAPILPTEPFATSRNGTLSESALTFRNLALSGDVDGLVSAIAQQRLRGQALPAICDGPIYAALADIGDRWERGVLTIAQEHFAANTVIEALARARPLLDRASIVVGKVILACPGEELHDIAIRMAALLAQSAGYSPIFVGARTPMRDLALAVAAEKPQLVILSMNVANQDQPFVLQQLSSMAEAARSVQAEVIVGGRGYENINPLPPGVRRINRLSELAAALEEKKAQSLRTRS